MITTERSLVVLADVFLRKAGRQGTHLDALREPLPHLNVKYSLAVCTALVHRVILTSSGVDRDAFLPKPGF